MSLGELLTYLSSFMGIGNEENIDRKLDKVTTVTSNKDLNTGKQERKIK